jgi:molybdopterin/thiamine biosynthesis adenylyltransferase
MWMAEPALSAEELERYARQIGPGVLTLEAQTRLKRSTVLVTRAGGMGGPPAMSLVMAGVGRVIVAHGGTLISPDLNRQVLGSERGIGEPRTGQFGDCLRAMNRFVSVEMIDHEPDNEEAVELVGRCDVVLGCAPTFEERLRLNRAAVLRRVPLVDASQWGMMGTLIVLRPGQTACLRCVYPEEPPFEEMFPVVGPISHAVGSLAALEAIKILSGVGQPMFGRLCMIDGYRGRFSSIELLRNPACPCCGSIP